MHIHLDRMLEILINKIVSWIESFVAMLPNMIIAGAIFFIFFKIAKLVQNLLGRALSRTSENSAVNRLLQTTAFIAIFSVGIFTALGVLNLERAVTSLLAGAGVLGLTIGFAFQEIASNFFAGILIAFKKPYREGDIVEADGGVRGVVSEITLRTTNLTTDQGLEVIIPNKDMFVKQVINYTLTPERRVDIPVGVSYGDDLREVEKVCVSALDGITCRVQDKPVEFFYKAFGASSVDFVVSFWVENADFRKATHEAIILIKEAFDKNEISIPYPIRTLDFGIKGGQTLTEALVQKES